jgi:DNA modification methylase
MNSQKEHDGTTEKRGRPGFNAMTPRDWTLHSRSVLTSRDVSSPREKYHLEHGATFSIALAERAIRMYTAPGDTVLDPFAGVGTTVLAARNLGRNAVGFELYDKFVKIGRGLLEQTTFTESKSEIRQGDCRILIDGLEPGAVQLTFTSPPYANFIQRSVRDRQKTHKSSKLVRENKSAVKQYGDDSRDFGNLEYDAFLEEVRKLMMQLYRVTCPGGYNVWVVKDHRDPQNGRPFIGVHSDIAAQAVKAGFVHHDLIVWDQNEQRSLVLLGYPSVFYVNINHSFLVVLRKPDGG